MAANRECGDLLPASQSISALVQGCSLQKTWLPQSLASEEVIWTWNNWSLSGQGSNSATCRTCRVSLRRSEYAVSYAQWIAVSANLFILLHPIWKAIVLERKPRHRTPRPTISFSRPFLGCQWMSFSRFVINWAPLFSIQSAT